MAEHFDPLKKENLEGNCSSYAQAIEAALPPEVSFVLIMFPAREGEGAFMAGRGTVPAVRKALQRSLESAKAQGGSSGRIIVPGRA
jgi:hypothetical protein